MKTELELLQAGTWKIDNLWVTVLTNRPDSLLVFSVARTAKELLGAQTIRYRALFRLLQLDLVIMFLNRVCGLSYYRDKFSSLNLSVCLWNSLKVYCLCTVHIQYGYFCPCKCCMSSLYQVNIWCLYTDILYIWTSFGRDWQIPHILFHHSFILLPVARHLWNTDTLSKTRKNTHRFITLYSFIAVRWEDW